MAKQKKKLRFGYTTGACAAAAALGAARMLKEQQIVEKVELELPASVIVEFALQGQQFGQDRASCCVVKDAGDDPDVTDGVEVHAVVSLSGPGGVVIEGGVGVGMVTKPGLPVAVGEPAINPVPRSMIEQAVRSIFADSPITVIISIPDGEERSRRTLNQRLGIIGGLSVLGTTGIVRPVSHQAWTDTIDVAIDVALACGCDPVVVVTGRTSEQVAQGVLNLPDEAFIMMGDHVGYAMEACRRKDVPEVIVAAQFAKLLKIACGHRQTHVDSSRLDLSQLAAWAHEAGLDASTAEKIECANTAREVLTTLSDAGRLCRLVAQRALTHLEQWFGKNRVDIMLIDYNGKVAGRYGPESEEDHNL
ncbi:MAG: cobalt-precorrin-5B (C(1))-methyltransferase [Desulfuromonas sp.]|nr:MAG: cobalt-precorrin-5B (C(1))-methyltransferase [Desulfuromonas sp.]